MFSNSPIWILKCVFQTIGRLVSDFLWHGGAPHIELQVLQGPWKEGGLAVPNFSCYFLAGQLVFVHRWLMQPEDDAVVSLEEAIVGSYQA